MAPPEGFVEVVIDDAVTFAAAAVARGECFDAVVVDVFDGQSRLPASLATADFARTTRRDSPAFVPSFRQTRRADPLSLSLSRRERERDLCAHSSRLD